MRIELWKKLGIKRSSLEDINKEVYMNHTYLKKYGAVGFEFDSESEFKHILGNNKDTFENEYTINENGDFVPGITQKK